jgi:hypothetical protein
MAWEEEEKKQESVSDGSETPTSESREAAEQQTGRPCCAGTRYKDMQTGHLGRPGSLALSARPGRGICIGRHCHRRRASVRSKQATTNHRPPVSGEHNPSSSAPARWAAAPCRLQNPTSLCTRTKVNSTSRPWPPAVTHVPQQPRPTPSPIAASVSPPASPFSRLARGPSSLCHRRPWVRKREGRWPCHRIPGRPQYGKVEGTCLGACSRESISPQGTFVYQPQCVGEARSRTIKREKHRLVCCSSPTVG